MISWICEIYYSTQVNLSEEMNKIINTRLNVTNEEHIILEQEKCLSYLSDLVSGVTETQNCIRGQRRTSSFPPTLMWGHHLLNFSLKYSASINSIIKKLLMYI